MYQEEKKFVYGKTHLLKDEIIQNQDVIFNLDKSIVIDIVPKFTNTAQETNLFIVDGN